MTIPDSNSKEGGNPFLRCGCGATWPCTEHGSQEGGKARFAKTYCSQCGSEFGPGDQGYSHCEDHNPPQRLTEAEIHAHSWWCPHCLVEVPPEMVTKDGEHYLESGGCGYAVRADEDGASPTPSQEGRSSLSVDQLREALNRAFLLGQTYWRQADSDSYKQNRLADETLAKFDALRAQTLTALDSHD